jgi:hypothetical protein
MRIHNLYTDATGESHFRDIEVEWVVNLDAGVKGQLSDHVEGKIRHSLFIPIE